MITRLYTIRDIVANEFGPVFEAKNDDVAIRSFKNLLRKEGTRSDEYELYCHGEVDRNDDRIAFRLLDKPRCIAQTDDVVDHSAKEKVVQL